MHSSQCEIWIAPKWSPFNIAQQSPALIYCIAICLSGFWPLVPNFGLLKTKIYWSSVQYIGVLKYIGGECSVIIGTARGRWLRISVAHNLLLRSQPSFKTFYNKFHKPFLNLNMWKYPQPPSSFTTFLKSSINGLSHFSFWRCEDSHNLFRHSQSS